MRVVRERLAIEPTANGRGSTSRPAVLLRGEDRRAVRHLPVRQRRPVLDASTRLPRTRRVAFDVERRGCEHDLARSG